MAYQKYEKETLSEFLQLIQELEPFAEKYLIKWELPNFYMGLAYTERTLGSLAKSERYARYAVDLDDKSAYSVFVLSETLFRQEKYEEALKEVEPFSKKGTGAEKRLLIQQARILLKMNRLDEFHECCELIFEESLNHDKSYKYKTIDEVIKKVSEFTVE